MMSRKGILVGAAALILCGLGVGGVVAGGLQDSPPQDARPADPIGDILRNAPPVEAAPAGTPAPASPIAIVPPAPMVTPGELDETAALAEEDAVKSDAEVKPAEKVEEPEVPLPRQRRRVAIVEAIDKVTAERMRFEVVVGGRPVRFNGSLIFSARACEVTAPNESVNDAVAYMDITLQPKGTAVQAAPRQIFRGWMFASTPAVSGLQHPVYDAWVVGCKA
ncbi:hypothetical protein KOAAANKH_01902 [Brevundimonas sp. NIBR10]|uniref:DUF2155 domain-containing protein n=1 Tax=Brevundimonas sp. NIBR10 TaxID=3015997 RepID=UPI0022F1BFC8|nr:DUF2155 domain-containing protein [Brevundimonas sp. NIBR10]WGM47028.1 hypothetical protein KOAAANKH_01902 [Brevundimonas sp. NIBR10]